jgi:hypothetical protein
VLQVEVEMVDLPLVDVVATCVIDVGFVDVDGVG